MTAATDAARAYAGDHAHRFVEELAELLRIPSVSTDPAHAADIQRAADWLAASLRDVGADNVAVMPTAGYPVVYGEWLDAGPDKPTVLVYGHYDVVPAALADGWETPPFDPVVKDGKIFARGATDDKGQLFIHVKAFEAYQHAGGAPVNLIFLLEGEEEVSSPNLRPFLESHLDLLKADVCVISDSSMPTIDAPAITHSLRGMTYIEVDVTGPRDDLHSGFYGGAVHNPALALVEILAKLHNPDHSIAVPGFYDDVVPLTDAERAEIAKTAMSDAELMDATGAPAVWGEAAFTLRERVSARPTLEINGLLSGWTGPGPKTIIPATAMAKISCRLVGNQDPHKIYQNLRNFIESLAPPTVTVNVSLLTTGEPALIDFTIPEMQAAARAYERGWGATPVFTRGGGSIPIVADIANLMKMPVVMMGYGLDTDGLHGANEHFSLEMFRRGIDTAIVYLDELANLPR
ncbi:MAG TPA: dipeptidase [Thermomicrobiales bacterium]|nr:dipeptidase [Thermomicrobiales bacterium]